MIRQRVYQIAAGYEDCNDADFLRVDPALRLALDKGKQFGASQSVMSRLENDILGTSAGQDALDAMITRSTDVLLKRKNKRRLIMDVDSTEDPAHGNQEHMAYNGHFGKDCFHPLFCFTSDGDGLAAKLRPGNVHSANGTDGIVVAGGQTPRSDNDATLYGSKAKITCKGTVGMLRQGELKIESDSVNMRMDFPTNDPDAMNYVYVREDFSRLVEGNSEPSITGDNGMQITKITEAIIKSSREGKAIKLT